MISSTEEVLSPAESLSVGIQIGVLSERTGKQPFSRTDWVPDIDTGTRADFRTKRHHLQHRPATYSVVSNQNRPATEVAV